MDCCLQKRRGRWYSRIRVPKELHRCLHAEISYPIRGSDLTTGRSRCKYPEGVSGISSGQTGKEDHHGCMSYLPRPQNTDGTEPGWWGIEILLKSKRISTIGY